MRHSLPASPASYRPPQRRGTPPQIVDRLNAEIKAVLLVPETEKRLINEGAEPAFKTPAELGSYVAAEMAK